MGRLHLKHTGPAHLLRLLNPLFLLGVNPAALGADSLRGPNIVLTSDAPGVRVEGAFERIRAPQSRSAAVLQAVDGGTHRVLFNAALGVSGYYRVFYGWRPACSRYLPTMRRSKCRRQQA